MQNTALALIALLLAGTVHAGDVNPFTGADPSIAELKRRLEAVMLKNQIANAELDMKRREKEARDALRTPPPALDPNRFGTLGFPTQKLPVPDLRAMTPPAVAAPPPPPAVPRLVGVMQDGDERVAIIELAGQLRQALVGETAHGLKVSKIGQGYIEANGRRLNQDNSALALVTNVDKQQAAPAGSMMATPHPAQGTAPQITPMQSASFPPPGFRQ